MKKPTRFLIVALLMLGVLPQQGAADVDLLVVYTPEARMKADYDDIWRWGRDAINAKIDWIVDEANAIFYNSELGTRVRLVGRKEIDHVESNDLHKELRRLQDVDYFNPPELSGYDLVLMSVDTLADLPAYGNRLIIVALVDADLHIRIFDHSGKKVVDKAQNQLTQGEELTALQQLLTPFPQMDDLSVDEALDIRLYVSLIAYPLDGHMDVVHAWRNEVGADVVGLIVATEGGQTQGVGVMPGSINDFDGTDGFLVSDLSGSYVNFPFSPAYIGMLFTHELGHVLGCSHDRHNSGNVSPAREYGYGYKFWAGPIEYGTIMATPNLEWNELSVPIKYFSNPDVYYWWAPTGAKDANNALLIKETTPLVEGYRRATFPGNSIWVDVAYNGYAGYEIGTFSRPYRSVSAGIYYVSPGGTIVFEQGSDPWTGTLSKPMTITAGIGSMTIGR